jgi:hypothetical protein
MTPPPSPSLTTTTPTPTIPTPATAPNNDAKQQHWQENGPKRHVSSFGPRKFFFLMSFLFFLLTKLFQIIFRLFSLHYNGPRRQAGRLTTRNEKRDAQDGNQNRKPTTGTGRETTARGAGRHPQPPPAPTAPMSTCSRGGNRRGTKTKRQQPRGTTTTTTTASPTAAASDCSQGGMGSNWDANDGTTTGRQEDGTTGTTQRPTTGNERPSTRPQPCEPLLTGWIAGARSR